MLEPWVVPEEKRGVMPVGEGAHGRVGGQVVAEPALLGAPGGAADDLAVGVEHDDVPVAQVVAVPPERRFPGRGAELAEVPGGLGHAVFVVPECRVGTGLLATPGRVIAPGELRGRSRLIGVVAEGGDGGIGAGVEEGGGGLVAVGGA